MSSVMLASAQAPSGTAASRAAFTDDVRVIARDSERFRSPHALLDSAMVAALRSRAGFETALLVAGVGLLAFVLPHQIVGDDSVRFAGVEQLIHHGHLTDSRYSLIGPLLSAPVLLLGEVIGTPQDWAAH